MVSIPGITSLFPLIHNLLMLGLSMFRLSGWVSKSSYDSEMSSEFSNGYKDLQCQTATLKGS